MIQKLADEIFKGYLEIKGYSPKLSFLESGSWDFAIEALSPFHRGLYQLLLEHSSNDTEARLMFSDLKDKLGQLVAEDHIKRREHGKENKES